MNVPGLRSVGTGHVPVKQYTTMKGLAMTAQASAPVTRARRRLPLWVVRLLALALVPVVVFGNPATAEASTTHGLRADWSFEYNGNEPGLDFDCTLAVYWQADGTAQTESVNGSTGGCNTGWSMGTASGDYWDLVVTSYGLGAGGELCGGSWSSNETNVGEPWSFSIGVAYGCITDQMCVTGHSDSSWLDDKAFESCASVPVGGPTEPVIEACPNGQPSKPSASAPYIGGNSLKNYWRTVSFGFTQPPIGPADQWRFYVVYAEPQSGRLYKWNIATAALPDVPVPSIAVEISEVYVSDTAYAQGARPDQNYDVIGFGLARSVLTSTWQYRPQDNAQGVIGLNDPAACQWYWGQKIAETSDDRDVPEGDIAPPGPGGTAVPPDTTTPPPIHEVNECSFSLGDPSTWLTAGMCAAVGLLGAVLGILRDLLAKLGDLLGFLGGLVADLVAALGNLLSSLFIPSPGFMDTSVQDVTDSMEATNVGEWKDTMDTAWGTAGGAGAPSVAARAGLSAGGGCQGPSITWDKFADAGLSPTIYPFKACTGMAATAADWSRLILTFVIGFGGLMKIAQMLMASMGFVRQTDIMLGHDWGSDRFS